MEIDLGRLNVSHFIEVIVLVGIIVHKKGAPTVPFTNECLTRKQEGRIQSDCWHLTCHSVITNTSVLLSFWTKKIQRVSHMYSILYKKAQGLENTIHYSLQNIMN